MSASLLKPPYILFRRIFRRAYWRLQTPNEKSIFGKFANEPERQIWSKMVSHLPVGRAFLLAEGGCQNGRVLYMLAERFPEATFIGYDLNAKAIKSGNKFGKSKSKVILKNKDMLAMLNFKCPDYFYACASLIYLDPTELKSLLLWLQNGGCKGIFFCEPSSTTGNLKKTHIYMHAYEEVLSNLIEFRCTIEEFRYAPWEGDGYCGKVFILDRES